MVKDKITFFSSTKTTGSGVAYKVINPNPLTKMYLSLTNVSAGSSVVAFQGLPTSGSTYLPIACKNMATSASATSTTGTLDEMWEVPLCAIESFRLNVTVSSGSLTAIGKIVQ
jgi:hypothetical protein